MSSHRYSRSNFLDETGILFYPLVGLKLDGTDDPYSREVVVY